MVQEHGRRIMRMAEQEAGADMILVDSGSNLGAINRLILPAADYIAFPLGNDVFSLEGLSSLGAVLKDWKDLWRKRLGKWRTGPENDPHRLATVKHCRTNGNSGIKAGERQFLRQES